MGLQLAIGNKGDLTLWCVDRGFTSFGGQKFWVINGHWAGVYHKGQVYIGYDGDDNEPNAPRGQKFPGKLLWRGRAPYRDEDYNEAMAWLRDYLKRQPDLQPFFERMEYGMATKEKIKFSDAVQIIDADRHNERVSALATAFAEMNTAVTDQEARLVEMKAYRDELSTKGEAIESLSNEEFSDLFNRHAKYT